MIRKVTLWHCNRFSSQRVKSHFSPLNLDQMQVNSYIKHYELWAFLNRDFPTSSSSVLLPCASIDIPHSRSRASKNLPNKLDGLCESNLNLSMQRFLEGPNGGNHGVGEWHWILPEAFWLSGSAKIQWPHPKSVNRIPCVKLLKNWVYWTDLRKVAKEGEECTGVCIGWCGKWSQDREACHRRDDTESYAYDNLKAYRRRPRTISIEGAEQATSSYDENLRYPYLGLVFRRYRDGNSSNNYSIATK